MTHLISKIYIVQTKLPTAMKIYIILYVIMHLVSFKKMRMSVFWPHREFVVSRVLWVHILPTAELNFCRSFALWVYSAHSVK